METLTGTTTREVTFRIRDPRTRECIATRRFPAGTEVYVREDRKGRLQARVCGTRFAQHVLPGTVAPA